MSEFMANAKERLIVVMQGMGIPSEAAGMVASEWSAAMEKDWGGERPYIGKGGTARREQSRRDAALLRDHHAGERVAVLVRRYGISERQVHRIINAASQSA